MIDWIIIRRYLEGANIEDIEREFKHSFRTKRNYVRIERDELLSGAYTLGTRLKNMGRVGLLNIRQPQGSNRVGLNRWRTLYRMVGGVLLPASPHIWVDFDKLDQYGVQRSDLVLLDREAESSMRQGAALFRDTRTDWTYLTGREYHYDREAPAHYVWAFGPGPQAPCNVFDARAAVYPEGADAHTPRHEDLVFFAEPEFRPRADAHIAHDVALGLSKTICSSMTNHDGVAYVRGTVTTPGWPTLHLRKRVWHRVAGMKSVSVEVARTLRHIKGV